MSLLTLHLTGSEVSANRDISVADGYLYVDPATGSSDYYTNTASGVEFPGEGILWTQALTGTTFVNNISAPLMYKRETDIIFQSDFIWCFCTIGILR